MASAQVVNALTDRLRGGKSTGSPPSVVTQAETYHYREETYIVGLSARRTWSWIPPAAMVAGNGRIFVQRNISWASCSNQYRLRAPDNADFGVVQVASIIRFAVVTAAVNGGVVAIEPRSDVGGHR